MTTKEKVIGEAVAAVVSVAAADAVGAVSGVVAVEIREEEGNVFICELCVIFTDVLYILNCRDGS